MTLSHQWLPDLVRLSIAAGDREMARTCQEEAAAETRPRFAAEFSGTDRTVAEFLLTEVLDRQSEEVRRLLLRTSVLERVSGPLADVLTGGSRPGASSISRSWCRRHSGCWASPRLLVPRRRP